MRSPQGRRPAGCTQQPPPPPRPSLPSLPPPPRPARRPRWAAAARTGWSRRCPTTRLHWSSCPSSWGMPSVGWVGGWPGVDGWVGSQKRTDAALGRAGGTHQPCFPHPIPPHPAGLYPRGVWGGSPRGARPRDLGASAGHVRGGRGRGQGLLACCCCPLGCCCPLPLQPGMPAPLTRTSCLCLPPALPLMPLSSSCPLPRMPPALLPLPLKLPPRSDAVVRTITQASDLAPLHNPPNLMGIEAARRTFGTAPHVRGCGGGAGGRRAGTGACRRAGRALLHPAQPCCPRGHTTAPVRRWLCLTRLSTRPCCPPPSCTPCRTSCTWSGPSGGEA